jgi:hypothetical protein
MKLTDEGRERVIDAMAIQSLHAQTSQERHHWFQLMKAEIAQRSPEQIAAMEKAKGLRAA